MPPVRKHRGRNNLGRLLMQLRADYMESIGR